MSHADVGTRGCDVMREEGQNLARSAAGWLFLAAAPTFAIMAVLTGVRGGGAADTLCSIAGVPALSGMMPMYLLMSAFHSASWLKLIARRRGGPGRS